MVGGDGEPFVRSINIIRWQTALSASVESKCFFRALANRSGGAHTPETKGGGHKDHRPDVEVTPKQFLRVPGSSFKLSRRMAWTVLGHWRAIVRGYQGAHAKPKRRIEA
jgi:hypothetical protein